ncbi:hybrid sensor histidine kinase/response regulator [Pseudoduganella umbonata]|uniref:Sensory/regulatory protein RpfC n=1 Tax=Pseudoduganella umbonata TaxID=864828 RepID=A0A4P8HVM3_9BURK|nr:response regulator [Pseudoduganella umbonata]MBB3224113.1 signal transduction histidine kinase/DNA-binding response OmpR family regulator/HPt (histidine-containing phosphotransfer) domain-containing protein [Pseudoduganella umbonata]QCP14023.1 response regulator [Pseudoduganella umbonata]
MFNFERSGLSRKLTLTSVLSTCSALLLVFAAFALTCVINHTENQTRQVTSLADVIAINSVAPLLYVDRVTAEQALGALVVQDEITQAVLYDRNGKPFARFPAGGTAPVQGLAPETLAALKKMELVEPPTHLFSRAALGTIGESIQSTIRDTIRGSIRIVRPVRVAGHLVGAVMIEAGATRMWLGMLESMGITAVATGIALAMALALAARFKGSIAEPIGELIAAAQRVSSTQTYAQVQHQRSDELGTLIDSFNEMMAQIEYRDTKLAQYRDQLERQVSVRTEQLEKAKNAAEAASRAKSAFLATMSHEIRTPMNGVLGMTELLLATGLTEQQRHYTSMVQRSGEHLLVIINDILDFSKVEAGKLTVEYIHFNFRELLDDIDYVFSPQAQAKGLELELAIAPDIPVAVIGDPNRLRQVIVNLLGNAIKFTDAGRITVRIAVIAEDAQSVGLRVEVHDTGVGVSRDARTRIFDSFSQADGSTTRKHGGTGLGLAISKQLVELMGGTIGVDNALIRGSIFWFTVRFDKRRVDADEASFNQKTTKGLRALLVDAGVETRAALEALLARWHLKCDCADSAGEALRLLRAAVDCGQPYDVALLDMELPEAGGLVLAADIKADPALAAVRLLLLSTERNAADTVQRREAGVAFQLIKPARESDLYDCIVTPLRASEGVRMASPQQADRLPQPLHRPVVTQAWAGQAGQAGLPGQLEQRHPAVQAAPQPGARRRHTVLLAEDNPVNVEVACAMLEALGLAVHRTCNGEEALAAVKARDFDLVLMDCQMPVMDGMAATAEIRRLEQQQGRARRLPIIAITANALQGDRETCLAAGMDDYLSKPFSQAMLRDTLARWVALPRAALLHHGDARRPVRRDAAPCVASFASFPAFPPPVPAPAPRPAEGAINRHALDAIRTLSADKGEILLQRVLHAFIDDTPRRLASLREAIDTGNAGSVRKVAHSLKSSSANVGADTLAQLSKDMEQLGRNDINSGAAALLSTMEREYAAVRDTLTSMFVKET